MMALSDVPDKYRIAMRVASTPSTMKQSDRKNIQLDTLAVEFTVNDFFMKPRSMKGTRARIAKTPVSTIEIAGVPMTPLSTLVLWLSGASFSDINIKSGASTEKLKTSKISVAKPKIARPSHA